MVKYSANILEVFIRYTGSQRYFRENDTVKTPPVKTVVKITMQRDNSNDCYQCLRDTTMNLAALQRTYIEPLKK